MLEKIQDFDFKFLEWIYLHRIKDADEFLVYTTQHTTYVTIGVILIVFGLYFIKKNKKYLNIGIEISLVIILSALVNFAIKNIIRRPRPFQIHDTIKQLVDGGSYSFPSGHTMEVFALATTIFILFRKPVLSVLFLFWAIWIGYTRVAMGVHYPLDVLGGMMLGILTAFLILKFRLSRKN